jgi:hypothetical protein
MNRQVLSPQSSRLIPVLDTPAPVAVRPNALGEIPTRGADPGRKPLL